MMCPEMEYIRPSYRTRNQATGLPMLVPLMESSNDNHGQSQIIEKLEQKRRDLDSLIAQYVSDKQKEYDEYEQELFAQLSQNAKSTESKASITERPQGEASQEDNGRGRSLKKPEKLALPSSRTIWPGNLRHSDTDDIEYGIGDRTSIHEREKELHDLFTPFFLPLLDAGGSQRSNSAPPPPATADSEDRDSAKSDGYQSDSSNRQRMKRAQTEPYTKPILTRKSSLRSPKKTRDRKKRVSLIIDDEIVRPSESPKEVYIPLSPTDDPGDDEPNVAITDPDGPPVYVWVPEKARVPHPNEDAMDYIAAVGGTLHHAVDLHSMPKLKTKSLPTNSSDSRARNDEEDGGSLQRFPSDSLHRNLDSGARDIELSLSPAEPGIFNMSPEAERKPPPVKRRPEPLPSPLGSHPPSATQPTLSPKHQRDNQITSPQQDPITNNTAATATATSTSSPETLPTSPRSPISPSTPNRAHHTSYIDKFSTSSSRLFGNFPTTKTSPDDTLRALPATSTAQEARLAAYTNTGGPTSSYVGSLGGKSGVDNVDIGSAGYPSSLGASFMEKFAAARAMGGRAKERENEERSEGRRKRKEGKGEEVTAGGGGGDDDDDNGFLGEMEDF